jgi:hypothetical protein
MNIFILRIWREPREIEGATPLWRGVITHLADGEKAYFKSLDKMVDFILPYLEEMGVQPNQ